MKVKIGMDVEFMAFKGSKMLYARGPGSPKELQKIGCDEFGHCIEIRPKEAEDEYELIGNIMREMSNLPGQFSYRALNAIRVPEKDYINLVREQGRKEVPKCKNLYDIDVLATTEFEKEALKTGDKILYCGMHVHVSTALMYNYKGEKGPATATIGLPIPAILLTKLFDMFIFSALAKNADFHCGKYRNPGFYEMKSESHFEYRSLGSSAFTPERVALIFRIVKCIVENHDELSAAAFDATADHSARDVVPYGPLPDLVEKLVSTKPFTGDLLKIWKV